MRASKENARAAMGELVRLSDALPEELRTKLSSHIIFLQEFLEAAVGRLPKEETMRKDQERKKANSQTAQARRREKTQKWEQFAEQQTKGAIPAQEVPADSKDSL